MKAGQFGVGSMRGGPTATSQSTLRYRLFVPENVHPEHPAPLIVALHGCQQNARDFAIGTGLDEAVSRYGALALYPEQSKSANTSGCWNWFLPEHQTGQGGEPAAIVRLIQKVSGQHKIDANRIYVVGLSAGGAMAAILGEQNPDVFAGVGIMAGVALHASHDVASAFAAMSGNKKMQAKAPLPGSQALSKMIAAKLPSLQGISKFMPQRQNGFMQQPKIIASPALPASAYNRLRVMIWAGANDSTVAPANADELAHQYARLLGLNDAPTLQRSGERGATIAGWEDAAGTVRIELWTVEGMGHAWSGGRAQGSYTFPQGPDATRCMLSFFLSS